MRLREFKPEYFLNTDDGQLLYIMIADSDKQGGKAVFSVPVDRSTGEYLGKVVESRLRAGFNDAPCFEKNRVRYYISWLKPLSQWTKS